MRSLCELEEEWSVDDVAQAHEVLDEIDFAESKAHERARAESRARR